MRPPPFSFRVRHAGTPSRRARAPARGRVPAPRRRPGSAPAVLRAIASAILVSGWLGASVVAMQARTTPEADAVEYLIADNHVYPVTLAESRRARQLVRRTSGDLGLWFAQLDVGLRSLLRPPRLAWTLWILSTAVGVACLQLAKLSAEDIDD